MADGRPWWEAATIYQIYPRSFQDSDGDGIGDLAGITARLDYLVELGVDALWLSPIFPSPMADFGYDVADYCDVDPQFGTLAEFDALLAAAHARGLRVLLDFVPNHSSDQHPWFVESRSSRDAPKRNWYIWRDPAAEGGPPNNWISDFGGPAWEWDEATGQYYSHAFLKEQPDLNWRNLELRAAMLDVLRFWFARGVDGFRIDVLWHMIKHADFPNNPVNPDYVPGTGEKNRVLQLHSTDQPEVHEIAAEMRAIADGAEGSERLLIGEIYLPVERLMAYYGTGRPGVHLPFNFQLIEANWDPVELAQRIADYEAALPPGGWPNWVLGNHDRSRVATRVGEAQARVAAMLLLTLRGTPTLYYGDELGLADVPIPAGQAVDPQELREPGRGRDPVRTPMPWHGGEGAGFTTGRPWLPLNPDHRTRNVAAQDQDPAAMLTLTRQLLMLRRNHAALSVGSWHLIVAKGTLLAYARRHGDTQLLVALNLGAEPIKMTMPAWAAEFRPLLSTLAEPRAPSNSVLHLRGNEAMILGPAA